MSNGRVVVGICTHARNEELDRLLAVIARHARERYQHLHLGAVVADDNPDLSARAVVERWAAEMPLGVQWRPVGAQNISAGRNRLIDAALELDADLVYVDDDEVPDEAWLDELLRIAAATDADVVIGAIQLDFPPEAPRWLHERPLELFGVGGEDASEPVICLSGNALLTQRWLRRTGVRFDIPLGETGGEDTDFFERARAEGARIRHAAHSLVHEIVPPRRATLRYQLAKEFRRGALAPRLDRDGMPRWRMSLRAGRYVVSGLLGALAGARRGRSGVYWRLAWSSRGLGMLAGIAGWRFRHA